MTPLRRALAGTATAAVLTLVTACGGASDDTDTDASAPSADASEDTSAPVTPDATPDDGTTDSGSGGLSMADVEANDTPDSCWAAIDGTVYDLTDWIDEHPGGSGAIQGLCGTDATEQFQGQHGGQSGPENQLAEFEVGELAG